MNLAQEEAWWEGQNKDPGRIKFAVMFEGQHIGGCGYASLDRKNQNGEVGLFASARNHCGARGWVRIRSLRWSIMVSST